jgi:hypothetical protein
MTTVFIKKKLAKAINNIEDPAFLSALHTIVSNKMEDKEIYELSVMQKKELDNRKKLHGSGQSKSYSLAELKKSLLKNK